MPNATVRVTDHELTRSPSVFISFILFFRWVQNQDLWYSSLHQWNVQNRIIIPPKSLLHPSRERVRLYPRKQDSSVSWACKTLPSVSFCPYNFTRGQSHPRGRTEKTWMNNLYFINFDLHYVSIHKYFRDKIHIEAKRKYIFKSCIMLSF